MAVVPAALARGNWGVLAWLRLALALWPLPALLSPPPARGLPQACAQDCEQMPRAQTLLGAGHWLQVQEPQQPPH